MSRKVKPTGPAKVRLETAQEEFVEYENIPSFDPLPDVLIWGSRIFTRTERDDPNDPNATVYQEAFTYAIP